MTNKTEDKVYANPLKEIKPFTFDESVADVFENMITRSVPGYENVLQFVPVLTKKYAQPESRCYDLGCSLGATTLQIRRHLPYASCRIIAVDNSQAMVSRCERIIERDRSDIDVEVRLEDIRDTHIENASLVAMNFTLQFIAEDERLNLLSRIALGINKGGILLLSEKVRFEQDEYQSLMTDLHHEFKKHMGYSDLEIAQKRSSLENVLVPDTLPVHHKRLKDAGFSQSHLLFQALNFVTLLAIK